MNSVALHEGLRMQARGNQKQQNTYVMGFRDMLDVRLLRK